MSHQVVVTTLIDGPKDIVLHVYIESDGTSDDIVDHVIVDPADLDMPDDSNFLTVKTIESSLDGFSARLKFGYLVDGTPVWVLPEDMACFDFTTIGGLRDRSPDLDGDGKVLLSTRGLNGTDAGSFVIKLTKI